MYCMHVHIPVTDLQVHLHALNLGEVVLVTSVSALLANLPAVLKFILLGVLRGRVLLPIESPNNGKLAYTYTIMVNMCY